MGCGDSCVKYILFFFNLFFALCGLLLLGIGIAVKLNLNNFNEMLDGNFQTQPILCIIIGAIIFVIAFFGCCGAVRESNCMMVTYAIFMIVIILAQVIIAIIVFVYIGDIDKAVEKGFRESFDASISGKEPAKEAWNTIQKELQCCGVNNKYDYKSAVIPSSCCKEAFACTVVNAYEDGCLHVLTNYMKTGGKVLGGVAIGVAVVEVITVIFALCFANSIRNADRRSRY